MSTDQNETHRPSCLANRGDLKIDSSDPFEFFEKSLEASPKPACPIPAKETADEVAGFCSCGTKNTCSKMSSCAEAKHFLNVYGVSRLDANKDGISCEAICK